MHGEGASGRVVCLLRQLSPLLIVPIHGGDGQAELNWVADHVRYAVYRIPQWFTRSQTVTHPSTHRAGRRATSLIETNVLPLSQTTTSVYYDEMHAIYS